MIVDLCVVQEFRCRPDDAIDCWGYNDVGKASSAQVQR